METASPLAVWAGRAGLVLAAMAGLLVALAPLGLHAGAMPAPDLVFLVLAAALVRRPDLAPLGLVAAVSLVSDLLRGAPLGLGTLALLAAALLLGPWRDRLRRGHFLVEWLAVSAVFAASMAFAWLLLLLSFAPRPHPASLLLHVAVTALAYPPVLLILRSLLGSGRGAAGQPA